MNVNIFTERKVEQMFNLETITVGVPETWLVLLFGMILVYGNNFHKKLKMLILKFIFSTVIILTAITIVRANVKSIIDIGIISMIMYMVTYRFVFNFNVRKSLIVGSMSIFFIVITEIIFMPFLSSMLDDISLFQATLGTRLIQFFILSMMIYFNIGIGKLEILEMDWKELPKREKIYLSIIILLIILVALFNMGYSDLMVALTYIHVKSNGLSLYFIQNIVFAGIVVYLLKRTRNYQIYKEFLGKTREDMFIEFITYSSDEEITIFKKIIDEIEEESQNEKNND